MRSGVHRALAAVAVVVFAVAVVGAQRPVEAASSASTVVGATVPSAITLGNQCHAKVAWSLGQVLPGSATTTATGANVCRFTWASTNDSSMLRIHQADRTGDAMQGQSSTFTTPIGSGPGSAIDGKGSAFVALTRWSGTSYQRSSDSGATFATIAEPGQFQSVSVVDGSNAWRTGMTGTQVTSTLGSGTPTWTNTAAALPASCTFPADISAVSASTAWVMCSDHAYRTADTGATWSDSGNIVSNGSRIEAVSSSTAYAVAYGVVRRSTNSNVSWTTLGSALSGKWVVDVSATPGVATSAWAVDSGGAVYRTANTGTAWTALPAIAEPPQALSIEALSTTSAIVGGYNGKMYFTTDSGVTWNRWRSPLNGRIARIAAIDASHVGVVGNSGAAFATTNGGSTWTNVVPGARDAASDADATDSQTILTSDAAGKVQLSTNGGSTWTAFDTGMGMVAVNGVALHASGTGTSDLQLFAVGNSGSMAVSRDGGSSWSQPTSGTAQDLWDIDVRSDGVALAVGAAGTILRSVDWGATWTTVANTGASLLQVELHPSGVAIAVGAGGVVRRSTDSGATWSTRTSGTTEELLDVSMPSSSVVYAAGYNTLLKSIDGGATWTVSSGPGTTGFARVAAASESTVWVFISEGYGWDPNWVSRSTDGGATWSTPLSANFTEILSPIALDTGTVLMPGEGGGMRVTSPAPTIANYSAGAWAGGTSRFGVCVQALGGSAAAGSFTVDGGTCTINDADPWYAVPTTPTKIGMMASAGTGSVDLVWGMRASSSGTPGEYTAGVAVTAVAPNA